MIEVLTCAKDKLMSCQALIEKAEVFDSPVSVFFRSELKADEKCLKIVIDVLEERMRTSSTLADRKPV